MAAEGLIGLAEASHIPGAFKGKGTHHATITRWITHGIAIEGGRRLKLEAVRIGGRWATTRAAVLRFIDRQQPAEDDAAEDAAR